MSIPKITGREARELLDAATPGPWRHDRDMEMGESAHYVRYGDGEHLAVFTGNYSGANEDGELIAAAPALAETVAWLYGKSITPDEAEGDYYSTFRGGYTYADQGRVHLNVALSDAFTPDEAVDLARALLAAAEEARP